MKIIYRITIVFLIIFVIFVSYLSIIGIETNKFNNQITKKIQEIDSDLKIELKKIKIILNPLELKLNVKTIGPKLNIKGKILEIENIKTQIQLNSILNKNFKIENLNISTKSVKVADLVSFLRIISKKPELYVLERFIKKGFLIADINLNFDENGRIKKDYKLNGFVKDLDLKLIDKYQVKKLNFIFNYEKNNLNFKNIDFSFNNLDFFSDLLLIQNNKDDFLIQGEIDNKKISLEERNVELFIKPYFSFLDVKKIEFVSKNKFSFKVNKKLEFSDFELLSKIKLNNAIFLNNFNLKNNFSEIKKNLKLSDHNLQIEYKNKNFIIFGEGNILLQNKIDKLKYSINKKEKIFNFETSLELNNNPFKIDILDYKKNKSSQAKIKIKGESKNNKTNFDLIEIEDNDIKLRIKDLKINDKLQILDLKKADIDYYDNKNKKNKFNFSKEKDQFILKGNAFNAEKLIKDLLLNDRKKKSLVKADFMLKIDLDRLYLDKDYFLENFTGFLFFNNDEIIKGNLIGSFLDNKKLKFTVNSNNSEKITTLFTDKAKPIINNYKFIKGFNGGKLDFLSSKSGRTSISTVKVYNFKLKELPFLTKILTLASLQGIADLLSGEGIRFDEFEMNFTSNDNVIEIKEIYAIGPAISIMMDGYVEKNKLISLRGTLVPATTINKVIGSIPILGKILVGSKTGEGVFGVSFKIKGDLKNPETTVNPIKTLTPRFITRTLEKINKTN